MAITKFDLYNPEWLELVFDNRNKDYGAYDLRKHYSGTLLKAMGITFFGVAFLYMGYNLIKPKPTPIEITRTIRDIPIIPPTVKPPVVTPPRAEASRPHVDLNSIRYQTMVVTQDQDATNPPDLKDLATAAIGSETKKGIGEGINIDLPSDNGTDMNGVTEHKDEVLNSGTIEIEPQPYGGAAAWAKFLQKNIHYPPQASEAGVQGKVFLSFIVETDGHLSDITIENHVGYGLDEEAARVLKLAPAWKPGIQNGHKVRVKYNIPISFVIPESE